MANNLENQFVKRVTIIVITEIGDFGFEVSSEFGLFLTTINVLSFGDNPEVPEYIFVNQEYYDLLNQLSIKIESSSFSVEKQSLVLFCNLRPFEDMYEQIIMKLVDMPKPPDY
jgi:hypothetical protein